MSEQADQSPDAIRRYIVTACRVLQAAGLSHEGSHFVPTDPRCPLTRVQIESKLRRSAPNANLCDELLEFVRRDDDGIAVASTVQLLGKAA